MKKTLIIAVIVLVILAGVFAVVGFFKSGTGGSEKIELTKIKSNYGANENIVVAGLAGSNREITILFNNQFGMAKSDNSGNWVVNLGQVPEGDYGFEAIADDSASSNSIATAQISVGGLPGISFVDKLANFLTAGLSFREQKDPVKLIMVPINASALNGEWNLVK